MYILSTMTNKQPFALVLKVSHLKYHKKWKQAIWKQVKSIHIFSLSLQEQLFLRFLSRPESVPNSLFLGFDLHWESRESDSWSSTLSVCSTTVADSSMLFCMQQQQVCGTGCPSRFKVWVWKIGAWANRVLITLCSIRLFFCSGGSSSEAASKQSGFLKK